MRPFRLRQVALVAALAFTTGSAGASEDLLTVSVDHARIVTLDAPVETVIVGNPMIVDIAIHDSQTLILTGRSYGTTNLVALDREGNPVIDEEVAVSNAEAPSSVRVYRQSARATYTCSPNCEPSVTVGDTSYAFNQAIAQIQSREGLVRGAASTPMGQ